MWILPFDDADLCLKGQRKVENNYRRNTQETSIVEIVIKRRRGCSVSPKNRQMLTDKRQWNAHIKCCTNNCHHTNRDYHNHSLKRVAPYHELLSIEEKKKLSIRRQIKVIQNSTVRSKITDCLGLGRHCKIQGLRYCSKHETIL